jgi:hypothetical protein
MSRWERFAARANAPLTIWFLSTVVVAAIVFGYTKFADYLQNRRKSIERLEALHHELEFRLRESGLLAAIRDRTPVECPPEFLKLADGDESKAKRIFRVAKMFRYSTPCFYCYSVLDGKPYRIAADRMPSVTRPEFNGVPISSLLREFHPLQKEASRGMVVAMLSGIEPPGMIPWQSKSELAMQKFRRQVFLRPQQAEWTIEKAVPAAVACLQIVAESPEFFAYESDSNESVDDSAAFLQDLFEPSSAKENHK